VDLRICTAPAQGVSYHDLFRLARCTEEAGFNGFFCADHPLQAGPGEGRAGGTDTWTTLAGLARETSRIRLGAVLTPAAFRLPGPLAVTAAQVDQMSQGRVELGVRVGCSADGPTAYGVPAPPGEHVDRLTEQLEIITGLWATPAGGTFDYQGSHYRLAGAPAPPTPAQRRLPVLIGGIGPPGTPALAARFADEISQAFPVDIGTAAALFDRVAAACTEAGRDPRELVRSVVLAACVGRDGTEVLRRATALRQDPDELRRTGLAGTAAEVVDRIGQWRECAGVGRLYLQVLDLEDLDHVELIAEEILRAV
jgi:alkanesulfonate monooxygenase SsuD/methylene tetrahydromethanopterin reductase-like flavin-dependent oxidoreductase (luciferase family)